MKAAFIKARKNGIWPLQLRNHPLHAMLAESGLLAYTQHCLGGRLRLSNAMLIDKNRYHNWVVQWHQDICSATSYCGGHGPVMGNQHDLLRNRLTLRIHFDTAGIHSGALKVFPGSHRLGVLSPRQLLDYVHQCKAVTCATAIGDVLIMKPLLVHGSDRCRRNRRRRVLQLDFDRTGR